jgi:hypothetical protein
MESLEMNKGEFSGLFDHVRNSLQVSTISPILDEGIRKFAEDYLCKDYSYDKKELKEIRDKLDLLKKARLSSSENYVTLSNRLKDLTEFSSRQKKQAIVKSLLNSVVRFNPSALFVDFDSFSKYIDSDKESRLMGSSQFAEKAPEEMINLLLGIFEELNRENSSLGNRLNVYPSNDNGIYIAVIDKFTTKDGKQNLGEGILEKCSVFYLDGALPDDIRSLRDHPVLRIEKHITIKNTTVKIKRKEYGRDIVLILTNSLYVIPFQLFQEGVIVHGIFKRET